MAQFGDYELVEKIGEGGMAMVYKGVQGSLGRPVAIKVLSRTLTDDPEVVESFNRESLIIARLNHPNIIHVIDRGIADAVPYFVMEFVEGTHLGRVIAEGRYDFHQKVDVIIQMCKALAYAHKNGVIHLDIKPANILIDTEGNVMVADFGIAHLFGGGGEEAQSTPVMGTPSYMSPEQKLGTASVTRASDIYSLGVVMYELFTGKKPVVGVLPSAIDAQIPRRLDEIIVHCLRTNPADRFAGADAVKDALLALLQGSHIRQEQKEHAVEGFKNLADKFGLLDVIQESRFGADYLFENRATRQLLVIKKIFNAKSGVSEARLLANLKHPHVADVYGTSTNGRVSIIVMEYLAGGCLKDRLANVPPWQESLLTVREICDGLSFLHKNRMIHGNLRPANILMSEDGHAKLSGIGLEEHYLDDESQANWYSLPDEPKSVGSDIFSAGMIFSEMLTGSIPIEKKGHLIQNDSFRSLPMELRRMIAKMLAPDLADRYGNSDEILAVIDDLLVHANKYGSDSSGSHEPQRSMASRLGLSRLSGAVGALVKNAFS
ncbi:MAG: protein kinase [Betaproteobacteria bacterium]|nr:protein kinase [Betaproteobacteria bacterium]